MKKTTKETPRLKNKLIKILSILGFKTPEEIVDDWFYGDASEKEKRRMYNLLFLYGRRKLEK